jgi:hypothetical protein
MKEEKQKIIKTFAGELGHVDCHYLSKDLILSKQRKRGDYPLIHKKTRCHPELVEG